MVCRAQQVNSLPEVHCLIACVAEQRFGRQTIIGSSLNFTEHVCHFAKHWNPAVMRCGPILARTLRRALSHRWEGSAKWGQRAKTNRERYMRKAIWMVGNLTIWVVLWTTTGIASAVPPAAFPTTFNNPIGIDWDNPNSSGLNNLHLVDSPARTST